ncbi:hypothetical protein OUZ56_011926 [Daphnia magna]|uniref:THAP-type domain-containing protein n=1 Tax=Daphnia magna TaxID=35525 RepID=A0ABQ9Z1S8_9CRUS|nr:hypothetical protein OUZ56_011926 [Daphnia magna]
MKQRKDLSQVLHLHHVARRNNAETQTPSVLCNVYRRYLVRAVDYTVLIPSGNFRLPKTYLPSEMAQPRTRDGSTTSMPDIGIPVRRNRNDTVVGSQSGSSDSRSQTSRTPEERFQAIKAARVERDTLVTILEEPCREIEQLVNNRGRRSILKPLKTQIHSRLEQVRDDHFLYNQRLWEARKPMTDAYTFIIGIEIHVRGVSQQVNHYLCERRDASFYCQSCYQSHREYGSLARVVTKHDELLFYLWKNSRSLRTFKAGKKVLEWQLVISKTGLTQWSRLCIRHFDPRDIVKGKTIRNIFYPNQVWKLQIGAIPKHCLGITQPAPAGRKPLVSKTIASFVISTKENKTAWKEKVPKQKHAEVSPSSNASIIPTLRQMSFLLVISLMK